MKMNPSIVPISIGTNPAEKFRHGAEAIIIAMPFGTAAGALGSAAEPATAAVAFRNSRLFMVWIFLPSYPSFRGFSPTFQERLSE